ncbi:MAG: VWA domain-containing protein [Bryobacteraceae bacterium]|jgi:Ca-activated chloride channel family protein
MKFAPATVALAFLFAGAVFAEERTAGQFRADANLVLINATVLDRHDRPVRGLLRDDFRIFEDKAEQHIAYFSEEETPLSLAVIFDVSGSMDSKMAGMRSALDEVLKSANASDEFSLITFANRPEVAVGWSANPEEIQNRLLQVTAHGETSLLDALAAGLTYLKKAKNARKALLIFSDGGDNHSRSTERGFTRTLEESGVQIFAVDSAEPLVLRTRSPEEILGPGLLERLCDRAGGRYFRVESKREVAAAAQQISRELRSQYLIGYVPWNNSTDGRFHHVRLQLNHRLGLPKVSVLWRRGYRASGD